MRSRWDKLRQRDRMRRQGSEDWRQQNPFMLPLVRTKPREHSSSPREAQRASAALADRKRTAAAFLAWRAG